MPKSSRKKAPQKSGIPDNGDKRNGRSNIERELVMRSAALSFNDEQGGKAMAANGEGGKRERETNHSA